MLERRWAPAILTVNTLQDETTPDSFLSLREAMNVVNAQSTTGLSAIRCHTKVTVGGDELGDRADRLLRSAERYCVVLSTLRNGVEVDSTFELGKAAADGH